ncbi:hypothetical protein P171DRAFT_429576 [Karstenula rhodostoma CBS 690.94]|uniref:mRNA export factor GLE1 n=1 Tax=Karstenula rhodostoma CBS 690.94 TaxID=1392251 RepID=A0A9P4PPR7_9PLEO|nr:hypothetical protein P171DRAFT_429576 [Karstenula rhodostoma CBS 690.94]
MPAASGASSATMNTRNSFSSSWLGSSPSRQSPVRQSPQRNALRSSRGSLLSDSYESPTRKLQLEFTNILSHSDREFHKKLDQDAAERARLHEEQLARAAREHQRVLEDATREMERIKLEDENERLRKAAVQETELQRLKEQKMREQAEAQQRQLEAKLREEQVAREATEKQRRIQEAAERAKAQKEQEEAARRAKEEQERRAREAAAAPPPPVAKPPPAQALATPSAPAVAAPIPTSAPSTSLAPSADIVEVHKKYLTLHRSMKQFRKQFLAAHKHPTDPLKNIIGEARRNMNKRMGQITVDIEDSKKTIKSIRAECFDVAISAGGPMIDVRPYLISHQITNDADAQYPELLLYLWIMFEKYLVKQWSHEASKEDGRIITQLSLIAASLYLDTKYMSKGTVTMTDTLLAKLHRVCPMLFGIRGNTKTDRAGLGLDKVQPNEADHNAYLQRMFGVGAGYAALTHRKFAQKPPAIPISEYWRAVVLICNTPAEALYPAHFMTLQGLLRDNVRKFLATYGVAAKAVLRRATFDLPNRVPEPRAGVKEERQGLHAAASLVRVLPDVWQAKDNINIR